MVEEKKLDHCQNLIFLKPKLLSDGIFVPRYSFLFSVTFVLC